MMTAEPTQKGERIRVLHVDDEPSFTDITAELLEREDPRFEILSAQSSGAGLTVLGEQRVDCIVSDYDMPGRDGIEFLEAVRRTHGELPFILFTGKGSEEVASEAISAGVTDYLQKEGRTEQYEVLANRILNTVRGTRARQQLDVVVDNLPGLIYQHRNEPGWPLTLIRGDTETLLGYTESELQEDVHLAEKTIHPEDREYHNNALTEGLEEMGSYELSYRIVGEDGESRWVRDSGQKYYSPLQNAEVFSGLLLDITELKEHEQALEEQQELYSTLVEQSHDGVAIVQDKEYTFVNSTMTALTGLPEEELVGTPFYEVIAPEYHELVEKRYEQRVRGEQPPNRYEIEIITDDGERRLIDLQVSQIQYEGAPATLATFYDITELKED